MLCIASPLNLTWGSGYAARAGATAAQTRASHRGQKAFEPSQTRGATAAEALESFLGGFFAREYAGAPWPCAAVALVKDGTVVKGYGRARPAYAPQPGEQPQASGAADEQQVDPEATVFNAGSVSKVIVAVAVMQLVEQGRLNLDDDVNRYLRKFKLDSTFSEPVTLANLLTHTSGIDDRILGTHVWNPRHVEPLADYFARRRPVRVKPPGRQIALRRDSEIPSSQEFALAGHLVEEVTGLSFAEYVERNIFEPLGMNHSSFRQPPPAEIAENASSDPHWKQLTSVTYPAYSMVTTASDMGRLLAALLNDGRAGEARILSEDSVRELLRQRFAAHPGMPGAALGLFESFDNGFRSVFQDGMRGHKSLFYMLPEERAGLFISYVWTDDQPGPQEQLGRKLVREFLDRFYPAREKFALPDPPSDFGSRAKRYTGWFRMNVFSQATFEKILEALADVELTDTAGGTLTLESPFSLLFKPVRLVEVEPRLFVGEDGSYYSFSEEASGRVTAISRSGGMRLPLSLTRIEWYESGAIHVTAALVTSLRPWPAG